MPKNPLLLLGLSTIFASIPVAVWLFIFFRKAEKSKKIVALVFGLGCLTAPALLGLQYLWDIFPRFNLASFVESSFENQNNMYIAMVILFGALEEIIKMYVITVIDKKTVLIKTVNDSVRYSLTSALGFSFTENIYYLYEFWPSISTGDLMGMYLFRSIFTACAHMIFSGIFGYFYGIGKFSIDITEQSKITGESHKIATLISKIFNLPLSQAMQQQMALRGLFTAIFMHATYNYFLQYNQIPPVMLFVVVGYLYLRYLLKRKAGHLILVTDISEKRKSQMPKKDEDVVIELLGMWFNEKKYVDVIHICERLLERDPDNNVVQLFKAKAMDRLDNKNVYKSILGNVLKTKNDLSYNDKNIISKYVAEKEMMAKVKEMIKEKLKKEGKEFKESKQIQNDQNKQNTNPQEEKKAIVDKFTEGEAFNLKL